VTATDFDEFDEAFEPPEDAAQVNYGVFPDGI
jgi:hypothetical protein